MRKMILLVDNFDSFTYNLAHAFGMLGHLCTVRRPDRLTVEEVERDRPEAIVISPGPGRPSDFPLSCRIIERFAGVIPILGVCLGHQCIAEVFGGSVVHASLPVHGKACVVYHDGRTVFEGLRNPLVGARYHSLVVREDGIPDSLEVSAFTVEGEVMGLRATGGLRIEGLQFHPESIATPKGSEIIRNFLSHYLIRPTSGSRQGEVCGTLAGSGRG